MQYYIVARRYQQFACRNGRRLCAVFVPFQINVPFGPSIVCFNLALLQDGLSGLYVAQRQFFDACIAGEDGLYIFLAVHYHEVPFGVCLQLQVVYLYCIAKGIPCNEVDTDVSQLVAHLEDGPDVAAARVGGVVELLYLLFLFFIFHGFDGGQLFFGQLGYATHQVVAAVYLYRERYLVASTYHRARGGSVVIVSKEFVGQELLLVAVEQLVVGKAPGGK